MIAWYLLPFLLLLDLSVWIVHEAGHFIAWKYLGIGAKGIRVGWWKCWRIRIPYGLGVEYDADRDDLSPREQIIGAAAGPLASILFGIEIFPLHPLVGFGNIFVGTFALLPVKGSDGWNIMTNSYQLLTRKVRQCRSLTSAAIVALSSTAAQSLHARSTSGTRSSIPIRPQETRTSASTKARFS